jgi:hypothetical protein
LLALMALSVDALFLQAEMAVFDSTPLPSLIVKSVFILLLLIAGFGQLLAGRSSGIPRTLFGVWLAFVLYLIAETVVLVLRFGYEPEYVLFSYNAYYYAILLIPVLFYVRRSLDEFIITRALLVLVFPLGVLGIAQNLSGNLLLPTDSSNQFLQVQSWGFEGSIRAFSLFTSPSNFGHFIALLGALGVAFWLENRGRKAMGITLTIFSLVTGYCTLTRATHLEIIFSMLAVWLVYHRDKVRWILKFCPLVFGGVGIFVAFILPTWIVGISADLLSDSTLLQRYAEWATYGAMWIGNGLATFLFGAGLVQNDRFQAGADVLIDNSVLAIGVHIGFVGVVFWMAISWWAWRYMLEATEARLTPVRAAALGASSVWLLTSVFGTTIFVLLPFALFVLTNGREKNPAVLRPVRQSAPAPNPALRPLDASSS